MFDVACMSYEVFSASFEVKLNGNIVHSRLSTLAFPDYPDLLKLVGEVSEGKEIKRQCKQQAITDCSVM